jgi:hypothetical protein
LKDPQLDLVTPEVIWHRSLLAKIEGFIDAGVYERLSKCGKEQIFRTCKNCGDWESFDWRCNMKFCPICNWRIARERAAMLKLWSFKIQQPKHLCLTIQNFPTLTRSKIRKFHLAVAKLRRSKLWKCVKGGCMSTEITHGERGWHLHAHLLIDCRFLDMQKLSVLWASLVGQEYGIVYIKDCRGMHYLGEVTKYVVKGSELVKLAPELIAQFIGAIRGVRFFATFGTLFHMASQVRLELKLTAPPKKLCRCGCGEYRWTDEATECMNHWRRQNKH